MYQRSLDPSQGDSLGITVVVLDALFLSLAAVAIGIRLWSRKIQALGLSLNDYAAVLAWVRTIASYNIFPQADEPATRSWPSHHMCYRSIFLHAHNCFSDMDKQFSKMEVASICIS